MNQVWAEETATLFFNYFGSSPVQAPVRELHVDWRTQADGRALFEFHPAAAGV